MDEFGVLTERYGLKPQGKAAPMAASKRPASSSANINEQTLNFGFSSASNPNSSFKSSWSSSSDGHFKGLGDHLDDFFGGSTKSSADQSHVSSFEYDSIFDSTAKSSSGKSGDNDDIFGLNKSTTRSNGDVFSSFPSPPPPPPRRSSPVGDLLGGYHQNDDDIFSGMGNESGTTSRNASAKAESDSAGFDVLIPGFGGGSSSSSNGYSNHLQQSSSNSTLSEDPFSVFESSSKPLRTSSGIFSDHLEEFGQFSGVTRAKDDSGEVKSPTVSSIDELEDFAMGRASKSVNEQLKFPTGAKKPPNVMKTNRHREEAAVPRENKHKSGDNLESFFNVNSRSSSAPKSRTSSSTNKNEGRGTGKSTSSGTPSSIRKASSSTNIFDDLSSMFGDASIFGEFEEVEGESEERRKARLGRQTRTQQRVAKAVADMTQRDYQTQLEQEERHRIAENLDADIKRWAAGKESNMRALLSSLQYVLWPECGWEPVSLTDLITSSAVKKVYRKATLCIHPDKVQQKGASVQQKYIAEKVFDILKEAWKKYEAEELR